MVARVSFFIKVSRKLSCVTKLSHRSNKRTKAVSLQETENSNKFLPTLSLENVDSEINERRNVADEVFDHFKQWSITHILVDYLSDPSGCCLLGPNIGTLGPSAYCRALYEIGWELRIALLHFRYSLHCIPPNMYNLLLTSHYYYSDSRSGSPRWGKPLES